MPLFQMIALAAVPAIAAVPADPSTPAHNTPSLLCELVLEASAETAGRTRKTYSSRCPGLPPSTLHLSYEKAGSKMPAVAGSR